MYSVIVDWANRDFDLSLFALWKFLHPTHPPGEQLFSSKLCIAERCTVRRFWYLSLWRGCLLEESLGTRRRPLVYSFDCWNREARLRTIYLACFILQLIIIRKAGGGDLRPHPPHTIEVLRIEHLHLLWLFWLRLEVYLGNLIVPVK